MDTRYCTWCGTQLPARSSYCTSCGRSPWGADTRADEPVMAYESDAYTTDYYSSGGTPGILLAGGILAILAGLLALGQGLLYVVVGTSLASFAPPSICLCGGVDIIFGIASIGGGVYAMQEKSFSLALVGAILGMLGFGFIIGFVFGLIAVILIAVSHGEFRY